MKKRLEIIYSVIPRVNSFADVGCDHGIISYEMIKNGKCKTLYFSDVSAPSLKKAEKLLSGYENAKGIVCDGLKLIPPCDCVLIAGMGGENIIEIISSAPFLPEFFVLQPMKNCDKVRKLLTEKGYRILKDFKFSALKTFYDLILAQKINGSDKDSYGKDELLYGRDNLISPSEDFLEFLKEEIAVKEHIALSLSGEKQEKFCEKLNEEKALYERLRVKR